VHLLVGHLQHALPQHAVGFDGQQQPPGKRPAHQECRVLPGHVAVAVEHQSVGDLSRLEGDHACLAQSLRLANLLSRLVTGGDFSTLPALVDESDRYAAITKRQINAVVDTLQEKVAQLADAMSVEVASEVNYHATLVEAHAQLSIMAEQTAAELMSQPRSGDELDEDDRLAQALLTETRRLSAAARVFLSGGTGPRTEKPASEPARPRASHHATQPPQNRERLLETVRETAAGCRSRRESLSLAMVRLFEASDSAAADAVAFRDWFNRSPLASELADARWVVTARDRVAVLTPGLDRVDAARCWSAIAGALLEVTPVGMHVGVAGLGVVPKGFDAERLVEPAERCLAAAAAVAGPAVKSIEVF